MQRSASRAADRFFSVHTLANQHPTGHARFVESGKLELETLSVDTVLQKQ
jgi:hypothetical protein